MLVHKRHEGVQFKPEILPVGHDRVLLIQRKAFLLKAQPLGTSIPGEPGAATGRFFQYLPYFFKANDSGWGGEVLAPNERNKRKTGEIDTNFTNLHEFRASNSRGIGTWL